MKTIAAIKSLWARVTTANQPSAARGFIIPARAAGMYVDHDSALTYSAVYAAVAYRAETIACLPWRVYGNLAGGGSEHLTSHPCDAILHRRPNPYMTPFDLKCFFLSQAQLWGNAYAEIEFDIAGRPRRLWPITADRVQVNYSPEGDLIYEINNRSGPKTIMSPAEIFHLAGMGFDGIQGYSIISLARRAIGEGLAGDEFMNNFYANGTVLSGGLRHPKVLGEEAYGRLKDDFKRGYGGAEKAWQPIILEEGMEWQAFGMPLKDAQFIEQRNFSISDIARWFRVPPHKIGYLQEATYSNIEQQSIESVQDSILPWVIRCEEEANFKLISARNRNSVFTKMSMQGLLRGDSQSRSEYYKTMRDHGLMSANEIRELEELNPIGAAGDKFVMQSQFATLEDIAAGRQAQPPADRQTDNQPPDQDQAPADLEAVWRPIVGEIITGLINREKAHAIKAYKKTSTSADYKRYIYNYWNDHSEYTHDKLTLLANSIARDFRNGSGLKRSVEIKPVLQAYTDRSKATMITYHDYGGGEPDLIWNTEYYQAMITRATKNLISQVINGMRQS